MMRGAAWLAISLIVFAACSVAAAPVHFGARLTIHTQAANAQNPDKCNIAANSDCSFVLMQAFQCEFGTCTNGHLAPQDGTIGKVSLIACHPGSFTLQIASVNAQTKQVQVIRSGPVIDYQGNPNNCNGTTSVIESFPVHVAVTKGDYLAVDSTSIDFVNCSGGGNNTALFNPPLADGATPRTAGGEDGCFMLLEAFY
jgi:hypothetical protein